MRRRWRVFTAVSAVLVLGGCTMGSGGSDQAGPLPEFADEAPTSGEFDATEGDAPRSVVAQGSLYVTVADPVAAAEDAVEIVESVDGRIDRRSERPGGDGGEAASAELTVRIPSERLTATVDELKALGEAEDYQLTEDDVTSQTRDLDARISALRASTGRLSDLLVTAASTKDLLDIETTLSQRQSDLESLEAQARALSDQVDLATLTVRFGPESTAPVDRPADFLSGIVSGWEGLVAFTGAVLVGVGVLIPWLIVPAVAALVVLSVFRVRRRRTLAFPAPTTMEE